MIYQNVLEDKQKGRANRSSRALFLQSNLTARPAEITYTQKSSDKVAFILFFMSSAQIREEINREVALLPAEKERQVLDFVRFLRAQNRPQPTDGRTLHHLRGLISPEGLREMQAAIKEGCEQIDEECWK